MSGAIDGIEGVRAVVWDFDGVLNRAGRPDKAGIFPWQAKVAQELCERIIEGEVPGEQTGIKT